MICHLNKWKSWFLNTEVVRKLTLEIVISAVVSGDNMTGTPSPSAKIRGVPGITIFGYSGTLFWNDWDFCIERKIWNWSPLNTLTVSELLLLFRHYWLNSVELYGALRAWKGGKRVELGKSSLLSEKKLDPYRTPLPPFLKVTELGKITGYFTELSPMATWTSERQIHFFVLSPFRCFTVLNTKDLLFYFSLPAFYVGFDRFTLAFGNQFRS